MKKKKIKSAVATKKAKPKFGAKTTPNTVRAWPEYERVMERLHELRAKFPQYRDDELLMYQLCVIERFKRLWHQGGQE